MPATEPRPTPAPPDAAPAEFNVLSSVGPVLLRRYGPAIAVIGLLLFIVIKIIRRLKK